MTHQMKKLMFVLITIVVGIINSGAAYANTNQALSHFNRLGRIQISLTNIKAQISAYPIKSSYCEAPHANDKSGDRAALDALMAKAKAEKSRYNASERALVRIITNDGRARAAVGKVTPGGSGSIVDGSYFAAVAALNNSISAAYKAKIAELYNARTRDCSAAAGNGSAVSMPAFSVANPLVGVNTTGNYEAVGQTGIPSRFCHADEKREVQDRITSMREKAQSNELAAAKLRDKLRSLEAQTKTARQTAWNAADAAAKSGNTATQNNQVKQLRAYDAALKKIAAGIRQAVADQRKWRNRDLQLANDWKTVSAMPISDCTDPNLTPAGTLGGTQLQGIGGIAAPNLKPVEIPTVPTKVCVKSVKDEIIAKSHTALSNAWHNSDQWSARIEAIRTALKSATGNARQPLISARAQARTESAKWIKIAKNASDANNRALAIEVEDCSKTGGLLEIGKLISAFPGVHVGVPEATSTPYDLPDVPEYVCTWEEKQALIARAEKARKAASANHSQWGARASALGGLLYGENAVGGDRTNLLKAHAEARAQSDYWADQMLDVAPSVYWQLRDLEIRDCEKPENKTSMGGENANAGSINDLLGDARRGAPTFNGGGSANPYGPIGNGYPPIGYPDFDKIRRDREMRGLSGFDGSEAEGALYHTLGNVEQTHGQGGNHGGKKPNHMPSNEETSSPNANGSFSSGVGLDVETQPIEYRDGSENTTVTKMPGLPKYGNLNGPGPLLDDNVSNMRVGPQITPTVEIESLPVQNVTKVEVGSISTRVSGGMVQVAPPKLVVTAGAVDRPTGSNTAPLSAAEIEAAGGQ